MHAAATGRARHMLVRAPPRAPDRLGRRGPVPLPDALQEQDERQTALADISLEKYGVQFVMDRCVASRGNR